VDEPAAGVVAEVVEEVDEPPVEVEDEGPVEVDEGPVEVTEAEEAEESEPVGVEVAVPEPVTTPQQPQGVWTDEQAEAFRAKLREVTATFVDKAAGAVIGTVNTVVALIRSRTSSDRRGDDSRG